MPHIALLLCWLAVSVAWAAEINFSVNETFGLARANEPVSGGISFNKGDVRDIRGLALFRGNIEIPGQFSTLTRHGDNSLQWVLMDFTDDFTGAEKKNYSIKTQPASALPVTPVTVSRSGSVITIDNGVLQLSVDTVDFRGIHSLTYKGVPMIEGIGGLSLHDIKHGSPSINGPVTKAGFVYLGSSRATLRVEGRFFLDSAGGVGYSYMITVYAGYPLVRISAAIRNSINPTVGRAAKITFAKADFALAYDPARETAFDTVFKYGYSGQGMTDTLRTARAYDHPSGKGLAVSEKWGGGMYQPNINGTRISGRALEVDIIRKLKARFITTPYQYWYPQFYEDSGYNMRDLTQKTSEIVVECYEGSMTPAALGRAVRRQKGWLRPFQDPASLSESNALSAGRFGTVADEDAAYAKWGWTVPSTVRRQSLPAAQTDLVPRITIDIHGDTETDPCRNFLLQWARLGNQGLFDVAEAWARYSRDLITWRTTGFEQDGQYQQGTFVRQYSKRLPAVPVAEDAVWTYSVADFNTYGGCHTAMEGLADYYCLTGDPDAAEACVDYGEIIRVRLLARPPDTTGHSTERYFERSYGRIFCFLTRLYEITRGAVWADLLKLTAKGISSSIYRDPVVYAKTPLIITEPQHFGLMTRTGLPDSLLNYLKANRLGFTAENYKTYGVDSVTGAKWELSFGPRWEAAYMAQGFSRYFDVSGDEDLRDMLIGFAQYARWTQMGRCGLAHDYGPLYEVPRKGMFVSDNGYFEWDPAHAGCLSSFSSTPGTVPHGGAAVIKSVLYPSIYALAYSQTGYSYLMDAAKDIWQRGMNYNTSKKCFTTPETEIFSYALCGSYYGTLVIPYFHANEYKDDFAFQVTNAFREAVRHTDTIPPERITNLSVNRLAGNAGLFFQWTAPAGAAGYQLKYFKGKRIQEYPDFEYNYQQFHASGDTNRVPWWYANNVTGEPFPGPAGAPQSYTMARTFPQTDTFYAAVCSRDSMGNLSRLSNLVRIDDRIAAETKPLSGNGSGLNVYPNPFNPAVNLTAWIPGRAGQRVAIHIFDTRGQLVSELSGLTKEGTFRTAWNGLTAGGRPAASGIYAVRMTADGRQMFRKITLAK